MIEYVCVVTYIGRYQLKHSFLCPVFGRAEYRKYYRGESDKMVHSIQQKSGKKVIYQRDHYAFHEKKTEHENEIV